ncbi:MAG: hypothetical protein DI629_03370 [Mesorhizobium amorphae]|nr:MAG: hypothetical protein DI629_03370 [Mesorhizobium amorphae]
MSNHLVRFPTAQKAKAEAYREAVNNHFATHHEAGAEFAYLGQDSDGNWIVPFYGAPWEYPVGTVFEEPAELAPLRADGEIVERVRWMGEED